MKAVAVAVALSLFLLVGLSAASEKKRYDGDKVFKITPKTADQLNVLAQLIHAPGDQYDFWKEPRSLGDEVHLRVNANWVQSFVGLMKSMHIPFSVGVEDVQKLIDEAEAQSRQVSRANTRASIVNTFPSLEELYAWLNEMCQTYPKLARKCGVAGTSYENRTINYITIGEAPTNGTKKKIFIEGTMHAREWLGPSTIVWIINKMLTTNNWDSDVKRMLQDYDFIIIPVANPDGYEYTRAKERLWRKTRSKSSATCYGTDPNRNWDHLWATAGTSTSPCSDTYHGSKAFSEIETKTLSDFIAANNKSALAYFAVHSYSQYWLIPYGAGPKPTDYDELLRVANIGAKALMAVNKKTWKVGNIQEVIYPAAGGSIDWVKDTAGIKYCYAFELRPANTALNGFVVATTEIDPSGREVWAGLVASIDAMQQ